jgi:hypothetical protein
VAAALLSNSGNFQCSLFGTTGSNEQRAGSGITCEVVSMAAVNNSLGRADHLGELERKGIKSYCEAEQGIFLFKQIKN